MENQINRTQQTTRTQRPQRTRRRRWLKITLIVLAAAIILLASGFLLYVSDYYHAEPQTVAAIAADSSIRQTGRLTIIAADDGAAAKSGLAGTALVFYPGGKVEATAYIPLLKQIAAGGVTCVLVRMPFNLAVFDVNAAGLAFAALPEIHNWYIGGHSLGGAMASSYAASHPDKVRGLILLGAYIYGNVPPSRTLTIYGSEDRMLDRSKINYTDNVLVIQGGNHAQFGNYGAQKGDGQAAISRDAQQSTAVAAILSFLRKIG